MLGFPLLYFKGMRILMFQLSGFYCSKAQRRRSQAPKMQKTSHDDLRVLKNSQVTTSKLQTPNSQLS